MTTATLHSPSPVRTGGISSILEVFWSRVASGPELPALRRHAEEGWEVVTWRAYGDAVAEVAAGLVALGIEPRDRVAILASNDVRWHEADIGALSAAATSVPVYASSPSGQVAYILRHAAASLCFVGDRDQLAKVLLRRHTLEALDHVVVFGDVPDGLDDDFVLGFDDLRSIGRDRLASEPEVVQRRREAVRGDDVATIVYTSGTTGPPKGAELTHDNLAETIRVITAVVPIGPEDRFLSFLPLAHIAERIVSHFGQVVSGGETWFARSLSTVAEDLRACRPTIFFAVPRVWEKFQGAIRDEVARSQGIQRRLADAYLQAAGARAEANRKGEHRRLRDSVRYAALDRVVGAKIRAQVGLDKARLLVSGAAPIDPAILWWFHGIGLDIAEVYGQTEDCGPTTLNPPGRIRIGTVGLPLPGVEVRCAPDGEILVRGGNVCIGYHDDPDRTSELIDEDGWMHSGDVGVLDADGYLHITGRKKDLIITSSGKNIAPQVIETRLQVEPLISQAVVIGDGRPYLTALLGLDGEEVAHWATEHGKVADFEALLADDDLRAQVTEAVARVNVGSAPIEQIKTWRFVPRELTVAAGELTPTLKVRRDVVAKRYEGLIDEMYAAPPVGGR